MEKRWKKLKFQVSFQTSKPSFVEMLGQRLYFKLQVAVSDLYRPPLNKRLGISPYFPKREAFIITFFSSEWTSPDEKLLNVVACNHGQVVCATGKELYYLEMEDDSTIVLKS